MNTLQKIISIFYIFCCISVQAQTVNNVQEQANVARSVVLEKMTYCQNMSESKGLISNAQKLSNLTYQNDGYVEALEMHGVEGEEAFASRIRAWLLSANIYLANMELLEPSYQPQCAQAVEEAGEYLVKEHYRTDFDQEVHLKKPEDKYLRHSDYLLSRLWLSYAQGISDEEKQKILFNQAESSMERFQNAPNAPKCIADTALFQEYELMLLNRNVKRSKESVSDILSRQIKFGRQAVACLPESSAAELKQGLRMAYFAKVANWFGISVFNK